MLLAFQYKVPEAQIVIIETGCHRSISAVRVYLGRDQTQKMQLNLKKGKLNMFPITFLEQPAP